MGSNRKTTMAKLNRETRKHEKRAAKEARKAHREVHGVEPVAAATGAEDEAWQLNRGLAELESLDAEIRSSRD